MPITRSQRKSTNSVSENEQMFTYYFDMCSLLFDCADLNTRLEDLFNTLVQVEPMLERIIQTASSDKKYTKYIKQIVKIHISLGRMHSQLWSENQEQLAELNPTIGLSTVYQRILYFKKRISY